MAKCLSESNDALANLIASFPKDLGVASVLEIGCKDGQNLRKFHSKIPVFGIDTNDKLLEKAKADFASFTFKKGSILKIPFENDRFDFVFTRCILNYVPGNNMKTAVDEMYRVSKKYVLNMEVSGTDSNRMEYAPFGESRDSSAHDKYTLDSCWYRNMKEWWSDYKVKIVSDIDMHTGIDPKKTRFTLIKKL